MEWEDIWVRRHYVLSDFEYHGKKRSFLHTKPNVPTNRDFDASSSTARMENIVDNDIPVGQSIVNTGNWADGLKVVAQFPGTVSLGQSW